MCWQDRHDLVDSRKRTSSSNWSMASKSARFMLGSSSMTMMLAASRSWALSLFARIRDVTTSPRSRVTRSSKSAWQDCPPEYRSAARLVGAATSVTRPWSRALFKRKRGVVVFPVPALPSTYTILNVSQSVVEERCASTSRTTSACRPRGECDWLNVANAGSCFHLAVSFAIGSVPRSGGRGVPYVVGQTLFASNDALKSRRNKLTRSGREPRYRPTKTLRTRSRSGFRAASDCHC